MENKDFCVFILSHGRPNNIKTLESLNKSGYTGPIFIVIDNEDKKAEEYFRKFPGQVIQFDKKELADSIDEGNNFDERRTITHARNACWNIARELGYKYFVQLDDDYNSFLYRYPEGGKTIKTINKVFDAFIEFLKNSPIYSVAFSQGGDHIGGYDDTKKVKRKCMNSFFCSTDKEFRFIGAMNEDVNTYTTLGSRGFVFFTFMNVQLNQAITQSQAGGITDMYKRFGTYSKGFTTVMMAPSCVRINTMGRSSRRLHHVISWDNAVPCIIDERYKK